MKSHQHTDASCRRKNKYAPKAKVDEEHLLRLAEAMTSGVTASEAARALMLNRNTVNRYYGLFREALAREAAPSRMTVPSGAPLVGLFLGATSVQAQLVPDTQRETARLALRGGNDALAACSLEGWPDYDALGAPSTGAFRIMPCCLVGVVGQQRLWSTWRMLRSRLCRFRGIPRQTYWQHLYVCELLDALGPEEFKTRLLTALETAA